MNKNQLITELEKLIYNQAKKQNKAYLKALKKVEFKLSEFLQGCITGEELSELWMEISELIKPLPSND